MKENNFTVEEANNQLSKSSGLLSYFGTNDCREVVRMINEGNKEAKLVLDAMAYQIAKSISACAVPLEGEVDQIIITGGLSYSEYLVNKVKKICILATKCYDIQRRKRNASPKCWHFGPFTR